MSVIDKKSDKEVLRLWQLNRLQNFGEHPEFAECGPENVTVVCYFYYPPDKVDAFQFLRCAILETWRHCGMLKTVIVVNEIHSLVESFRTEYADWVVVQVEDSLIPGDTNVMSVDCNSKLHMRFKTDYVLIIQDDGFPLRKGLEKFLGRADFIGSPFRRRTVVGVIASTLLRDCPANGGFSLRTRKICQLAASYWEKYYSFKGFDAEQVEDIFYTQTLPRRFLRYRMGINMANPRLASEFSYDGCLSENFVSSPFGFHSARAFRRLVGLRQH